MDIQPITYRGRTVAACTRERIFLADALEHRPPGDPELTFVLYMCAYAGDVARGELPGPYTDADARHYARACLIPTELLERPARARRARRRAPGRTPRAPDRRDAPLTWAVALPCSTGSSSSSSGSSMPRWPSYTLPRAWQEKSTGRWVSPTRRDPSQGVAKEVIDEVADEAVGEAAAEQGIERVRHPVEEPRRETPRLA